MMMWNTFPRTLRVKQKRLPGDAEIVLTSHQDHHALQPPFRHPTPGSHEVADDFDVDVRFGARDIARVSQSGLLNCIKGWLGLCHGVWSWLLSERFALHLFCLGTLL